jgi:hypothetical protein
MDDRTRRYEMRKVKINLDALDVAFANTAQEICWYLDLETGVVSLVTEDSRSAKERIAKEIGPGDDEASVRAALEQSDLPDWLRQMVLDAQQIEVGFGTRYLAIPDADTREDYGDMEEFIETVEDERVQQRLWRAIDGRGAFRRFRDAIFDHEEERARWFAFRDARRRERILEWLADEGIELIIE